jgi:hypothetical protein
MPLGKVLKGFSIQNFFPNTIKKKKKKRKKTGERSCLLACP